MINYYNLAMLSIRGGVRIRLSDAKVISFLFLIISLTFINQKIEASDSYNGRQNIKRLSISEWLVQYDQAQKECYKEIPKVEVVLMNEYYDYYTGLMWPKVAIMEYPQGTVQKVFKMVEERYPDLAQYLNYPEYANAWMSRQGMIMNNNMNMMNNMTKMQNELSDRMLKDQIDRNQRQLEYNDQINKMFESHGAPKYYP